MQTPPGPVVENVLRAAVGHGLAGAVTWPATPLGSENFDQLIQLAFHHRLLGVLAEAASDASFLLLPEQLSRLTERHGQAVAHALNLERQLLQVADALDEARIDFRVIKGAALAHLVYADPSWRIAADIDMLIPSSRFDDAVALAIERFDGTKPVAELRPGFDHEFGKESMVRIGRVELDLHRTFVTGPFGLTIDLNELFADRTTMTIGGKKVLALSPEHQFLHACYNTALGDYPVRLSSVRDLLLCQRFLEIEFGEIISIARRWRAIAVIQRAAELVIEAAGPGAASDFDELAALVVPAREAWLLRSYLTPARSYTRPLASLAAISGIRPRLRYARAILAPSETYLLSRGWTGLDHFKHAVGRLRGRG